MQMYNNLNFRLREFYSLANFCKVNTQYTHDTCGPKIIHIQYEYNSIRKIA
jgi:hypothetical protein